MSGLGRLSDLWDTVQTYLFPVLEDELGELDEKHKSFVAVCETLAPQAHMAAYRWVGNGCPPKSRLALCQAFIAKAVWNFPTTRDLIEAVRHRPTLRRLCGWETLGAVPSEATFSRAFAAFAQDALPQRIQEAMIGTRYGDKIAGHVSRDATAIHARERAAPRKSAPRPKAPKKHGRSRQGEPCPPPPPTRLEATTGAQPGGQHRRPAHGLRLGHEEGQQGQEADLARLQAPHRRHRRRPAGELTVDRGQPT